MHAYDVVTQRIIDALERGVVPWHRPWTVSRQPPANLISRRPYRGINALVTWLMQRGSPWWLTFHQAKQLGGTIRKGEHGVPIMFFKLLDRDQPVDDQTTDATSARRRDRRGIPFVRHTVVFNATQTEGLDHLLPLDHDEAPVLPDQAAEALMDAWRQAPRIDFGFNHAQYLPRQDRITMPSRQQFESTSAYYGTLLHECAHATGHRSRLGRFTPETELAPFGSPDYSREELIAELASAFLRAEVGLAMEIDSSAAYIAHWLTVLRGDRRQLIQVAADAQRAADHICGRVPDAGTPAGREEEEASVAM